MLKKIVNFWKFDIIVIKNCNYNVIIHRFSMKIVLLRKEVDVSWRDRKKIESRINLNFENEICY